MEVDAGMLTTKNNPPLERGESSELPCPDAPEDDQIVIQNISIPGALIRLYWFLVGNVLLVILAIVIGSAYFKSTLFLHVLYWMCVVSLLAARYSDIRFLEERSTDGARLTVKYWLRYSAVVVPVSAIVWAIALLTAYFKNPR
jgi:hypothetical protein